MKASNEQMASKPSESLHPRKALIVSTARKLLTESGIQGVTIAAIAGSAGISEGGIYRHFRSRKEILSAVVDEIFEQIFALFVVDDDTTPLTQLRTIARRHSALMSDNDRSFARPWLEIIAAPPTSGLRERATQKQITALVALTEIAVAGQRSGEIREDIDPEQLAWEFLSWAWAENVGSTLGVSAFIDEGHSTSMIDRLLASVARV